MHSKALSVLKLSMCLLAGPGPGRVIRMVDSVVTHCFEHMNICFMDYLCVSPCMFAMGSRWPSAPANGAAVGVVVLVTALVLPVHYCHHGTGLLCWRLYSRKHNQLL